MWTRPSTASSPHRLLALAAALVCLGSSPDAPPVVAFSWAPPASSAAPPVDVADPLLADELVGTRPPEWTVDDWTGSPPLTLAGLRGRVVLVRWLMGPQCSLCWSTAASLKRLDAEYGKRGLVVVGIYHHNDEAPFTEERYRAHLRDYGFRFPVARDPVVVAGAVAAQGWKTLDAWWLDRHERAYSSPSFLLDRAGRIRGVHPGGAIVPGDSAYRALRRGVERLLAESER